MKYWFTSDTHFGHSNIIHYCNRPFKDVEEMDRELIKRWNEVVKKNDVVFHLGDLAFKKDINYYRKQLNGRMILLKGNHENGNSCIDDMMISLDGYSFFLTHRPENAKGDINLVGHVHEKWRVKRIDDKLLINVGVDVNNFYPVDINTIIEMIKQEKNNV